MAEKPVKSLKLTKMISAKLRTKATEFLNSRKNANHLVDILQMFEAETDNYVPLLLTLEYIFTELLKRGDLVSKIVPLKPEKKTPEQEYIKWLTDCYEAAIAHLLKCMTHGRMQSRLQALVTACKLMQAEGVHPIELRLTLTPHNQYYFPTYRLKNIFKVLLDSEVSMSALMVRFQEFTEYRDVQQYGLKLLPTLVTSKNPTPTYMQNYLELLDKLLICTINIEQATDNDKLLCPQCLNEEGAFKYNPGFTRRNANKCWSIAFRWPLNSDAKTHRRAVLVLVERMMPLLLKPKLATDLLCDSLDVGGQVSMIALQGVLELVQRHNIDYPDMYTRLYAMFEPDIFVTRYKRRLMHVADVFLSSTHLPESLVAAFAKRLSRLALMASPEDAAGLLQLVANLLLRHPALKRMICHEDSPTVMSNDPFMNEESNPHNSRALGSSLWEVAALKRHFEPALCAAVADVLAAATPAPPVSLAEPNAQAFDIELKKRFKTIEMNFIRPQRMEAPSSDRFLAYWDLLTA